MNSWTQQIRKSLTVSHPFVAESQRVLRIAEKTHHSSSETVREAREAVQHARVSALVELLLTGEFTPTQLRTLVNRLDDALSEFESAE